MKIKIKGFITSKKSELYSDCADNYDLNVRAEALSINIFVDIANNLVLFEKKK